MNSATKSQGMAECILLRWLNFHFWQPWRHVDEDTWVRVFSNLSLHFVVRRSRALALGSFFASPQTSPGGNPRNTKREPQKHPKAQNPKP